MTEILKHILSHNADRIAIVDERRKISYSELAIEIHEIKDQLLNSIQENNVRIII